MPTITAGGIGSGLDINSLVSQLVQAEGEATANRLNLREATAQAKLSAFSSLKSAMSAFEGIIDDLKVVTTFNARAAVSADEDLFTVSATNDAAAGNYGIEVVNLAKAQKLMSEGFASSGDTVGTGTLTIGVGGDTFELTIDDSNKTLAGIRDAINAADDNTGVTATIINVDDGGNTKAKLVLSSDTSGTASEITVAVDDSDTIDTDASGLSRLHYPSGGVGAQLTELQAAEDAQVKIDGQIATRSSNTFSDLVDGVTITLVGESTPTETTQLSVSVDRSEITNAVSSLVSNFNSLVAVINGVASYDSTTQSASVLFGDSTVRSIDSMLRRELGAEVASISGAYDNLAAIGVTTNANGTLALDGALLESALDNDMEAVSELFTASDGYAVRIDTVLESFTSFDGILNGRTDGLTGTIDRINDQREALNRRLASVESRLLAQFTAMDQIVNQLQGTSSFLDQQLGILQGIASGNRS